MHFIRSFDIFGIRPIERLHFNNNEQHKSMIGGMCSLLLFLVFFLIVLILGIPIYNRKHVFIIQEEKHVNLEE